MFYSKSDDSYIRENQLEIVPIKGYLRTKSIYSDIILDLIYTIKAYLKMKPCDILIQNTFWAPVVGRFFKSKYRKAVYNVARKPARHFLLYGAVDQFSCVSNSVQHELNRLIKDSTKSITVNNPVNLSCFTYLRREIPVSNDPIVVGYHGRVHPEKGLDILCKALQLLSNRYKLEFMIIGPYDIERGGGGQGYVDYLKSLAPDITIKLMGAFSDPDKLNQMLHECHIYCYPSVASGETFGVSPLEAMATGAPVIVSALKCFNDFIKDKETGFVFDHEKETPEKDLSKIIELLISNQYIVDRIGVAAYEESKKFSVDMIAIQYLSNFKKLLANNEE